MNDESSPAAPSSEQAAPSSHLPPSLPPVHGRLSWLADSLSNVLASLRFFSCLRLPVPRFEAQPFAPLQTAVAAPAVAVAGALIGSVSAAVLLASSVGLPPLLAAGLAITALVLVSGAMHEDGLADTADGLGGGSTPERRLDIMRDSRTGAFGVVAIVLALVLRVVAIAVLMERLGALGAGAAIVAVAATSRVASLLPLWLLKPARDDGLGAAAGRPLGSAMVVGTLLSLAATIGLLWTPGILVAGSALAVVAAFGAAWVVARIAEARLGGHTGDIAGAAQQLAEIAMLLTLVVFADPHLRL